VEFSNLTRGDHAGQPQPAQLVAWIQNVSEWTATDLALEFRFRDRRVVRNDSERLEPSKGLEPIHGGVHWEVVLAPAEAGGSPLEQTAESATLRYSDARRIARYEQTQTFRFEQTRKGSILTGAYGTDVDERRI
jgi:hypothetical protein